MGFGQQPLQLGGATFPEVLGLIATKKLLTNIRVVCYGNTIVDNFVIKNMSGI
jgi:hypothetical protein